MFQEADLFGTTLVVILAKSKHERIHHLLKVKMTLFLLAVSTIFNCVAYHTTKATKYATKATACAHKILKIKKKMSRSGVGKVINSYVMLLKYNSQPLIPQKRPLVPFFFILYPKIVLLPPLLTITIRNVEMRKIILLQLNTLYRAKVLLQKYNFSSLSKTTKIT